MKWLAVLDMDGTLLERRTVDVLCENLDLVEKLKDIDRESPHLQAHKVSARIAKLFSGIKASRMEEIFETMTLVEGTREFIDFLGSRRFITAIVTDSYVFLASRLAQKLSIDAVRGNELELANGVVTGRISTSLGGEAQTRKKCLTTAMCKLYAMNDLIKEYSIQDNRTLAVGDTQSDLEIIQRARVGVAFRPKDKCIEKAADTAIHTDFYDLTDWLKDFLDTVDN